MSGIRRSARSWTRAGLVLCLVAVPVVGTGVAAAAPGRVIPILECVVVHSPSSYTAVLGYDNPSGESVRLPYGDRNALTPHAEYDGRQPTTFLPGRQRGAFSVTVTNSDAQWTLQGSVLRITPDATPCPPATEMPVDGNGTGVAVGLGAAGLAGVLLVRRMQRRIATAGTSPAAPSRPDADDA